MKNLSILLISIALISANKPADRYGSPCNLLSNSKFQFGNIEKTMTLDEFTFSNDFRECSLYGKKLTELDSTQKVWLFGPLLTPFRTREIESLRETDVPQNFLRAQFVSKQSKIGDLQPIIVRWERDGYLALWLLILNKECVPVSYYLLDGGHCEYVETDSTLTGCATIRNRIKGNKIDSYKVRTTFFTNANRGYIDSVIFRTKISPTGEIKSIRVDSIRSKIKNTAK